MIIKPSLSKGSGVNSVNSQVSFKERLGNLSIGDNIGGAGTKSFE